MKPKDLPLSPELWRDAIMEELHVCHLLREEHYDNPKKALHDIVMWHIEVTEYFNKQNKWHNRLKNFILNTWYRTPFPFWLYKIAKIQPPF
jgi:hypothetical protein